MQINTIIGDCVDELRKLDENSIDLIFTSPPFKDEDVDGDYWEFYNDVFNEMKRVSSKAVIIIQSSTRMNYIISKYPPKRTLIWGKGCIQASFRYNPIFIYQKSDDYKVNKYIWSDTFGISPIIGNNKAHVYQDPIILYYNLLKMFKGIKTVCDPFAGSGTTGLACRMLDINCLLIDKNENYKNLIIERTLEHTQPISSYV